MLMRYFPPLSSCGRPVIGVCFAVNEAQKHGSWLCQLPNPMKSTGSIFWRDKPMLTMFIFFLESALGVYNVSFWSLQEWDQISLLRSLLRKRDKDGSSANKGENGGRSATEFHSHRKMKQANTSSADKAKKKKWIVCCEPSATPK